jgi:hypothetical protein
MECKLCEGIVCVNISASKSTMTREAEPRFFVEDQRPISACKMRRQKIQQAEGYLEDIFPGWSEAVKNHHYQKE